MRKIVRLSETEFRNIIHEATKQVLPEYAGFTFGRVSNGSLAARTNIEIEAFSKEVGGKVYPNDTTKRLDEPLRADNSDVVSQYKGITFMFLGTNSTKIDEPFAFQLESINKVDRDAIIIRGFITWDNKQFHGNISYLPSKGKCYYSNKRLNHYELEPVPPTKQAWDNLITFFNSYCGS